MMRGIRLMYGKAQDERRVKRAKKWAKEHKRPPLKAKEKGKTAELPRKWSKWGSDGNCEPHQGDTEA